MRSLQMILCLILTLATFALRVKGHYYPNHYFAHQSHSIYHNFHNAAGRFGFGIPPFGFHQPDGSSIPDFPVPVPVSPFQHINWLGTLSSDGLISNELKPSIVGWDTTYNVPCGSYKIHPFVIAHIRYHSGRGRSRKYFHNSENSGRSFYPPNLASRSGEPTSCSWQFQAFGPCKLKFLCSWFQLPALFKCDENFIELTDTEKFNYKFCGNRKPRGSYVSTSEMIKLTFKSQSSALPTVFDCAVSCGLEALNYGTHYNGTIGNDALTILGKPSPSPPPPAKPKLRYKSCKCGKRGEPSTLSRIVGGSDTFPGEFPWVAALVRKNSDQAFCGASLINDHYILSAAHCVQKWQEGFSDDIVEVLLNEHDISTSSRTIRIKIDKIIIHPKYNNVTYDHDIALLRLDGVVNLEGPTSNNSLQSSITSGRNGDFLKTIIPICLPVEDQNSDKDHQAIVTGWGLTKEGGIPSKTMMQAAVEIFNDTLCQNLYKGNSIVTDQMLCAGHLLGKMDSCVGDSGGPLIIDKNGTYVLTGVVSWGRGCARPNLPGVYTRLKGLTEWIQLNTYEDSNWCNE